MTLASEMKSIEMKSILCDAFLAGVKAAHPDAFLARDDVRKALNGARKNLKGRVLVLGAGKAAAAMAVALEREWQRPLTGLVITRAGYEVSTDKIEVALGGHPYPDETSADIAQRMLAMASDLTADDLVIGLWSGGGSALLACPPEDIAFELLRELTEQLLKSGANIHEINTVRKHLSQIAGGRLARAAAPASLLNLIISDVVSEDEELPLSAIASGPCVPDATTLAQARDVVKKFGVTSDPAVTAYLANADNETPNAWDQIGVTAAKSLTLTSDTAINAMHKALAPAFGQETGDMNPDPTGEARLVAGQMAEGFLDLRCDDPDVFPHPTAFLAGGELTVTVTGTGTGGPNQEFALALAIALDGAEGIYALSGDSDGIDGFSEAAGAFVAPDTLQRMRDAGIDPKAALANNDAGSAFAAIGDLLICGPTFTNVNDLRLIVING